MIQNSLDLYNSNKDWYDHLPERKYMIMKFLPECSGNVLNVGVHYFNKNDEVCCPKNCNYETIDIDKRSVEFGSSYKHTKIDFLDYKPDYKFDNILLFGVLGIYDGCGGYNYTLHNKESILIEHIDNLLDVNGRVLLGPDIHPMSGAGQNSYSNEEFWKSLINNNKIIKNKYSVVEYWERNQYWGNMIIVLRKNI